MSLRYAPALAALVALCWLPSSAHAQQPGDIIITEVLVNPGGIITDRDGEWFELYNNTNRSIDLKGWSVQDSAASGLRPMHTIASSLVVPAYGFVVLGGSTDPTINGGAPVDYVYLNPSTNTPDLNLANSLDAIRVIAPDGVTVIDRVKFASAAISAKNGISRELLDVTLDNLDMDGPNWVDAQSSTVYGAGGRGTPGAAGQTGGVLPVELVSFTATLDGASALLRWTTASETNNAGFDVEHRQGTQPFRTLGFAAGRGTTAETSSYSFVADGLQPGTHVFRLRQVDFDGAFDYSPEVEISVAPENVGLTSASPNPFTGQTQFSLSVASAQQVRVSVFDVLGREVATLVDGPVEAGSHTFTFEATGQPAGLYVIRAEGDRFTSTQLVTLVR